MYLPKDRIRKPTDNSFVFSMLASIKLKCETKKVKILTSKDKINQPNPTKTPLKKSKNKPNS